jgi:hypothetical protein
MGSTLQVPGQFSSVNPLQSSSRSLQTSVLAGLSLPPGSVEQMMSPPSSSRWPLMAQMPRLPEQSWARSGGSVMSAAVTMSRMVLASGGLLTRSERLLQVHPPKHEATMRTNRALVEVRFMEILRVVDPLPGAGGINKSRCEKNL